MEYTLPPLPYAYDALEPYIDKQTMELHYTKHHQAYIDQLNKALAQEPSLQQIPLETLLRTAAQQKPEIAKAIINQGGGHYNHSFFWKIMTPEAQEPGDAINALLVSSFGSVDKFKEQFEAAAKSVFGSGWAWLSLDAQNKAVITTTPNQENPIMYNLKPILGLDVWEHAYYLKYQNKRVDYIAAWWHVVNWQECAKAAGPDFLSR
jgi:superoxide dismutase, Fe-Mn family